MNKLRLSILGILFLIPMFLVAQNSIRGVVTEQATGDPLPNVNVKVQGTDKGTVTDFDGKYTIKANKGSSLIFSYIGYKPKTIQIDSNSINVVLENSSEALDEIIIIGYGSTTKKDATGSVTMVKSKDLKNEGVASPEQMLVGKVAGVVVTPSGSPGGGGTIRIRESTSLLANQSPLIVIDGVPGGSLYNLNNNDIESFSILKDASATAIYGFRASNGVILVTTKKGKKGKLKYNYSTSLTLKNQNTKIDVLSADEYRNFINANGTADQVAKLGTANTDWQDEIFDTGKGMNHDFSMSGGTDKINFRLGLGLAEEDGVLSTSNFEKGTYSLNLGTKLFKDKLKITTSYRFTQRRHRNADTGAIINAIKSDPTQDIYSGNDAFGGYRHWLDSNNDLAFGASYNPLASLHQKTDRSYYSSGIGNVKFDYDLPYLKGLRANLVLGIDHSKGHGKNVTATNSLSTINADGSNYGSISDFNDKYKSKLMDFYLSYKKDMENMDSNIEVTAGYSYQNNDYERSDRWDVQRDPNKSLKKKKSFGEQNFQSFFTRVNFNLKHKYLFTASLRRDGTSRFYHSKNPWMNAPSAAFAWKINKESFMENSTVFNNLKLRLGWGIVGQQDIGVDFPGLPRYLNGQDTAQYQFGNEFVFTSRAEPYNPLLKWEETETYNIGLDYGMFERRIDGAIDVFYRKSSDLLNRIPFPAGSSLSNESLANIGNMENQGVEFTINAKIIDKENFKLRTSLNATYNTLEITKLLAGEDGEYNIPTGGTAGVGNTIQVHTVGYSPNSFYVYQQVYDTNDKPIEGVYVDRNNDGEITSADQYRFKRPNADVTLGFNTNVDFKKFDFNMFWRASIGNFVYNNINSDLGYQNLMLSNPDVINNGVRNVLESGFVGNNNILSDYYIEDASFLKLDNLTVGYTFDKLFNLSNKMRVYGSVQNVLT
ncbi:MAG: SusC/RagA family TonB-linked outer membrane protein, partial [Flavobacteriaceae bacterium]